MSQHLREPKHRPEDSRSERVGGTAVNREAAASAAAVPQSPRPRGQSAIIDRARHVVLSSNVLPSTEAGQVRVRIEGCGVCGSNVPVWEGRPWFSYPLEAGSPGHEAWGTIDDCGPGVTGFDRGDRVALLSSHAFAEYDTASALDVIKLPAALDGQPFPAEPLACAINVFRRSEIQSGQTVVIIGIGFLGALLTQLCVNEGAKVIAVSRRLRACHVAKRFGAHAAVQLGDQRDTLQSIRQALGADGCSRVIEATGSEGPLQLAGELTTTRGRLVIAGYHQDGPRQINLQLWNWNGIDVINAHERAPEMYRQGMREAIDAVLQGKLRPAELYTNSFPLANLADALEVTCRRPDGFMKALVMMQP